mgnify:CR=1 FL=1
MILFTSDYTEGAHPRIIEKLAETNMEQTVGYGEDEYCQKAKDKIKAILENENVCIFSYIFSLRLHANPVDAAAPYFPACIPQKRLKNAIISIIPP